MIRPVSAADAAQIATWVYENEYAVYSFTPDGNTLTELQNSDYYAYTLPTQGVTGYFCFGASARIPAWETNAYTDTACDFGLGMRPELCGQGGGQAFVKAGMDFAQESFGVKRLRLTVAAFNTRAIHTYEKLGFRRTAELTHRRSGQLFYVMICDLPTQPRRAKERSMLQYVHTCIVAKDAKRLIAFYKSVLGCKSIGETRDLRGEWLDTLTDLRGAHITGEHLLLPGYGTEHPTLEIFQYDEPAADLPRAINRPGIAHLAFAADDVDTVLAAVLDAGGGTVGERIVTEYADGRTLCVVYARDPEGNIIELQSWSNTAEANR